MEKIYIQAVFKNNNKQKVEMMEKDMNELIEDIQQAIVEVGGRFHKQKEIKNMSIEELLNITIPNHIVFDVSFPCLIKKQAPISKGIEKQAPIPKGIEEDDVMHF